MKEDLTQGPVIKTMLRFAVPMIFGNLLQQCYNIADTLIGFWEQALSLPLALLFL